MKEKMVENQTRRDIPKPDLKRALMRGVLALGIATTLSTTSLALAAGADNQAGPPIMFYCTKPGEPPVYVATDNRRSYAGKDGWDCRPAPAP